MIFSFKYMVTILLISLFLYSCSDNFDSQVSNYIEDHCIDFSNPNNCIVDLNKITNFKWDNMYIFPGMTMPDEISEVIGFKYYDDNVRDNYQKIIFTKDKCIVYQNEYYDLDSKVQFRSLMKKDIYAHFTSDQSKFFVMKRNYTFNENFFYDLYPINGERKPK